MKQKFPLDVLQKEMRLVDGALTEPVDVYLIGGCAMSLAGLKRATKDLDLILPAAKPLRRLEAAFQKAGYVVAADLDKAYKQLEAAVIFAKPNGPQWDLFVRQVCRALFLSPGIIERAQRAEADLQKLRIHRVASSDIFIFKSITERVADREDMDTIFAAGLDWPAVLNEMRWQSKHSRTAWSNLFFQAMEEFQERGNTVPILSELGELRDEDVAEHFLIQDVLDDKDPLDRFRRSAADDLEFAAKTLQRLVDQGILKRDAEEYRPGKVPWLTPVSAPMPRP